MKAQGNGVLLLPQPGKTSSNNIIKAASKGEKLTVRLRKSRVFQILVKVHLATVDVFPSFPQMKNHLLKDDSKPLSVLILIPLH